MYTDAVPPHARAEPAGPGASNGGAGDGAIQAEAIAALMCPETYPEGGRQLHAIETHMSWVFLTERHAFKLKKAVRTDHFDCTTAAARRRACDNELALNRRLASDVYLAVVPLASDGERLALEAPGATVDWLVKMRRLPAERMLDACIERGSVRPVELDALAETLARFYAAATRADWSGPEYRARLAHEVDAMARVLATPRYALPLGEVEAVAHTQRLMLAQHEQLLDQRAARVVEAHGDLRPEHVCLDGPVVIDCLDFERELRLLDPASELAFLTLECRRLGSGWVGEHVLTGYARASGDRVEVSLIRFYQAQHALVRAAVAIWHLDHGTPDGDARWRERARTYLRLALEHGSA
jgi:aminoglycoside phosphotransferase family enzyme